MEINFLYDDIPTVRDFTYDDSFIRGLMGPFGSAKSSGCLMEIIRRSLLQEPGQDGIRKSRWAIVRNTYGQLKDTTIKTVVDWLPPHKGFGTLKGLDKRPEYIINGIEGVELELLFRALDKPEHVSNLLSLELTGAWLNEGRDIPFAIFDAIQGRVGRYPSKRDGGASWFGVITDTNPPDTDSWWYTYFEERKPENAKLFKQPSGLSPEGENISNLPPNYYRNLALGKDQEFVTVYVHGRYGYIQDGKPVYPEYYDGVHCTDVKPNIHLPIKRGWDFGLTPVCVFTQIDAKGRWNIFDELVSEGMGLERFADEVLLYCKEHYTGYSFEDYGDPAGAHRSETDERTCFQILNGKNVDIVPGDQVLQTRLECVRIVLNTMIDGGPALTLDPKCKNIRKGFQGKYRFRKMSTTTERWEAKPEKNKYSHTQDALQYIATRHFVDQIRGVGPDDEDDSYYEEDYAFQHVIDEGGY